MSIRTWIAVGTLLLGLPLASAAQILFERTYGGLDTEYGYAVRQTTDKGYIVAGTTESYGAGLGDAYLVRTNPSGDTLWTNTYGGNEFDWGYAVEQISDGGFIVTGLTYSFGAGSGDVYLIRTDASGDTLWSRTFGGNDLDWGYEVGRTSDGGFIIAGSTQSFGATQGDAYVIRTDSEGVAIWARGYGGFQQDYARSVRQTSDGGFIIAGYSRTFGTGTGDVYLIRTDPSGGTLWTKTFGGNGVDEGNAVRETSDGGFIIAGEVHSTDTNSRDVYLIRTDADGDSLWTRSYGGIGGDVGSSVEQTSDGGFIIAGYTESFGSSGRNVYMIRTDASGDTLWTRTYGGEEWDSAKSVWPTVDGGYVVAGDSESFADGHRDLYLIKTDPLGTVGIDRGPPSAPKIPRSTSLSQNFPNPFNPTTTIWFEIPNAAVARVQGDPDALLSVRLAVYDLHGRLVRSLVDSDLAAGRHEVVWDGRDEMGRPAASGIYLYRLEAGGKALSRKMVVLN